MMAGAATAEGTIAYFAGTSQNGFNQATYEGVQAVAAERGYETEILDGQFDAALQYSQIEDALASGRFVGMIVSPNDSVGIAGAFEQAIADGVPIGTVLFPVGPDLNSLEPQVDGITVTAASPPVAGATTQAEEVVEYCADHDPCNVVVMIGARIFPFDNLRLETFETVLAAHDNIEIVAVGEGYYAPDPSLQAMTDILQVHPDVNVVLSNADQHLVGVEIALEAAGINPADLYLSGGGAAAIAIDAIREGRWDSTLAYFPKTMGALAMEQIANAIEGAPVTQAINMDEEGPVQAMIDIEVLDANPEFTGEWEQ
ncbi:substrate-binding domain-containing protein [Roseobacter sp. HKCCD9056]|nr:substrate-binding domain-containing protein [Roseobacter sp. HKCCD9073]NNV60558.1 substrate-binding domain-containing protein [Roseobacter sp. HKCCD8861]NNW59312.1 substrate-binding domain-containing protein [Roseobacter sp. HKCCD8629]NNW84535.1 substrate-binding domain-containing protein [Roseobacter sp. HKCCD8926]NNW93502.1 substrate-binding domain-containing protein [Roseobacter sp. HKCCD9063]NNW97537.1 substrate-binding domain-containing protein [Roseobacter sp. HKCCD9159]NNX10308.1 su